MSNPYQDFTGKPGQWYVILDQEQYYLLSEVFGAGQYLGDFVQATNGYYYAPRSAVFAPDPDAAGIVGTGLFASEEWIPTTYVNTSQMPSLFGG